MVRWVAILSLGKAFSVNVAIRDTQNLKRSGLYHFARHPSYTGMMLMFLALGLAQNSWWACLCLLLPVTAALLYRIHVEEIALNEAFGSMAFESRRSPQPHLSSRAKVRKQRKGLHAHRHYLLSHLRRFRRCGYGIGHRAGRSGSRGAFHLLFAALPAQRARQRHPLSRGSRLQLSAL